MNREDQTEAPNEEIAGAPTLDSDEASRALARVQQVLDSDEDRARALEKAREKAEKAARAKSGGSEKPDEDDKDDEARPLTPEAAQQLRDILSPSILPTLLGYSKPCRLTTVLLSGIKSRVSLTAIFCSKSTRAFVRP